MFKKRKLGDNKLSKIDNEKIINHNLLLFKINKKCSLNLTPIKTNKNKLKIEKYVNYLLSYKKEKNISNLEPNINAKSPIKSEEKNNYNIKIKNIFNKYKAVNKLFKSRNKDKEEKYLENKTINNSELSYSKVNLFTFNSGAYILPLLTQLIMTNK